MKALIDGDILRYEIGFAAETGWKAITEREEAPPFDYVEQLLTQRIASIQASTGSDTYELFITEGPTFRFDLAKRKPYKGTRIEKKPFHFSNLTSYMKGVLPTSVCTHIEADDAMAINSTADIDTIICSRDKDLRQVPGNFYSWEMGKQPSFGPVTITTAGSLQLENNKLKGTGFPFFCAQMLMGDPVDNIPGIPGMGPVTTYKYLMEEECDYIRMFELVEDAYVEEYPEDENRNEMVEQGQLLWIVRRLIDGEPELWYPGLYE